VSASSYPYPSIDCNYILELCNHWLKIGLMARSLVLALGLLTVGCSSTLETGYKPKPLDMPISQRETLYSDPYSQHAMQAQQEQQQAGGAGGGAGFHRPGTP
jgi:hypothetical protein